MAPSRRKGASKAAAAAAARRKWKVGDLVLAKVKGFPAWPATVSEPEKWGYSSDWKKVLVYFFGTKQIAFCNPADVEEFTEEKKQSLLGKRHGRSSDFVRAVQEIVDCYDSFKENNQVDQLDSGDAPAENAAGCSLYGNNTEVADTTNNSRVKSSNSSRQKDEPGHTGEDVGALTEVDSLHKRDVSEDPDHIVCPLSLPLPNTYTLRKKSRSVQPQRCASKKKVLVQRSRSSSGFDSHGLQNGVVKCVDGRSSGDGELNGFWDGPLRRAKRSKRSPDGSVPNVGDSPVCNSNGTIEDNVSEIALADFETLSNNNEGSAIESNNKRDQSEVPYQSCEGGLELKQRLDLQVNTGIIRKKRNPGRRRALNDGLDSVSMLDQEANMKNVVRKDTIDLPVLCTNMNAIHSKDEGDEHLPLVKRARVRMGKLLAGEQKQPHDCLLKTEEKTPEAGSASTSREICTTMNCDDVLIQTKNCDDVRFLENISPTSHCADVQEKNPQTQKTNSIVTDELTGSSSVDNFAQLPDYRTFKTKESQPFGFAFDGEAALPPSKRLHRALEAMSANAAEENKTFMKVSMPVSPETDKAESHLPLVTTYSDIVVGDDASNNLELQNESLTCNNALKNESSVVPSTPNQLTCEIIANTGGDVCMVDSSSRILDGLKGELLREDAVPIAAVSNNEDVIGTVGTKEFKSYCQDQVLQATCCRIDDSDMLGLGITTLSKLTLEEFCKGEEEVQHCVLENSNSNCITYPERETKIISEDYEAADVGCHAGTTVYLSHKEEPMICKIVEEDKHASQDVNMDFSCSPTQQTCDRATVSGGLSQDQSEVDVHSHLSHPNDLTASSNNNHNLLDDECMGTHSKVPPRKPLSEDDESKSLDAGVNLQSQSGDRINLAEVKAAIASLELTLGSLTRTKESIGRATKIAIDCVKFGIAGEVVDLLVLYLEKESLPYKRVDLFFLVDSIAQCSRSLKGEVGNTYISAVKETLGRILAAAAPAGPAGKENRRQCLKVLRLWLDRRMLPDSIVLQHMRELESQNCSTSGYSRRMSRTERSFDDPLRDMEGMLVDEYGSNSSFQMPGFCMPRMIKEEDDGSDSDGGSFEAVTPEHDSRNKEIHEEAVLPATGKHRHILEEVDGELEMEDVAPCEVEMVSTAPSSDSAVLINAQRSGEQFTSFIPPLPPPLPSSPPPPPPPPPPPAPLLVSNASTIPPVNADSQLRVSRNETTAPRPPAPSILHSMPMPEPPSSSSYNSYPVMHNPVPPPGNNTQPPDANLYGQHYNNLRPPPYPSPSNQFSYFQADQQIRPQREVPLPPPPPPYYDRPSNFPQNVEGGHFYGEQDNIRPPPRHEAPDGWGYSRPQFHGSMHPDNEKGFPHMFSGMSCDPTRPPRNQGWVFPPHPVHHRNHIPNRPPCDGPVPVAMRAPGYWRPR